MARQQVQIVCSACGADTLLVREPQFEGIRRVGEILKCATCGHVYAAEEEVPFKDAARPRLFRPPPPPVKPGVLSEEQKVLTCRLCRHYVVNPFTQRCGLHNRTVDATDTCPDFAPPEPDETGGEEQEGQEGQEGQERGQQ
ncbi:MAG: hypothetical protein JXR37_18410 [Kiritimatiellae bacterium]|nr:hypothetical protein [Kiritimatiellia bacterium]